MEAQEKAAKASLQAKDAFSNGIVAGSEKAATLQSSVVAVEAQLASSRADTLKLLEELDESAQSLNLVEVELVAVTVDLSRMSVEVETLRESLRTTNERIVSSSEEIVSLRGEASELQTKLDIAHKWSRRWLVSLVILAGVNILYVTFKLYGGASRLRF